MNASTDYNAAERFPMPAGLGKKVEASGRQAQRNNAQAIVGAKRELKPTASAGNMMSFLALRSNKK